MPGFLHRKREVFVVGEGPAGGVPETSRAVKVEDVPMLCSEMLCCEMFCSEMFLLFDSLGSHRRMPSTAPPPVPGRLTTSATHCAPVGAMSAQLVGPLQSGISDGSTSMPRSMECCVRCSGREHSPTMSRLGAGSGS